MTNLDDRLTDLDKRLRQVGDATLGWAVGCSRKGVSHVREAKPCQDAWALWSSAVAGSSCLIAAVADGHGDPRHDLSHLGAGFALKAAVDELNSQFTRCAQEKSTIDLKRGFREDFPRFACRRWRELVLADAKGRDQSGEDSQVFVRYGTTLLAALVTENGLFLGQLGDGAVFLVRPNGHLDFPFREISSNIGTVTNSLCSANAPHHFHTAVLERAEGGLLFLATDGLINAFSDDGQVDKFASSVAERIKEFGLNKVAQSIPGWLDHFSAKGSGDDITLTLVCINPSLSSAPAETGSEQKAARSTNEESRHAT